MHIIYSKVRQAIKPSYHFPKQILLHFKFNQKLQNQQVTTKNSYTQSTKYYHQVELQTHQKEITSYSYLTTQETPLYTMLLS